jgi:two-component system, chemotaxis family, chemotaxis protein CheY
MSTSIRPTPSRGAILVVDDEPMLRNVLMRALLESGFEAIEAENGEEALRAAARCGDRLELVVTDLTMPVMSGIEFAREFRPRWPRVPILFITGKNPDPRAGAVHSLGEMLLKPFGPDVFLATVLRILETQRHDARFTA